MALRTHEFALALLGCVVGVCSGGGVKNIARRKARYVRMCIKCEHLPGDVMRDA